MNSKLLTRLLQLGNTPFKINQMITEQMISEKKDPEIVLRRCLCTQLVTQGDCALKDVVKQVRLV
jgi:hypothetical protein